MTIYAWAAALASGLLSGASPSAVLSAPTESRASVSAPAAPAPLPSPAPPSAALPTPLDQPYPGTLQLRVDATDLDHRVFHVRETVPVAAGGPLVLAFPKWLPGNHSATGPLVGLAGLTLRAAGRPLAWTRDPLDMYAFHTDVPAGADAVEVSFDLLTPSDPREGRVVMTPALIDLQWTMTVLYPAGYYSRRIPVAAQLKLPSGWKFASALEVESAADAAAEGVAFKPTDLETLADSPLYAGLYFAQFDLDPGAAAPVRLNVFADRPEDLAARPDQIAAHRNLVKEAYRVFGARRYDHYDFLLGLSDKMSAVGLEHHRSSEDAVSRRYFTDWEKLFGERDLLPHEFTHSWNGKYRRPADLWTATYDDPMRNSLLWVYEGQTEYWGLVLAARSGLVTRQQALDGFAEIAAQFETRPGRRWRPLQDTVNDPIIAYKQAKSWPSWQRGTDYYREGALIWLEADTQIRELTQGKRSLDDFARAFFYGPVGDGTPRTYVFEDVVKALNAIAPYDWAGYLRGRLDAFGADASAPLEGLQRGGYRLVYSETPTDSFRLDEARRKGCDLSYSLGLSVDAAGIVRDVTWEGVAYKAGLAPGVAVLAVNGAAYDGDGLKDAVRNARTDSAPIELILRNGDQFRTVKLDYHGGLRYPKLERDAAVPARLDDILTPRARRADGG